MRFPTALAGLRRNPQAPAELQSKTIVAVLGMHRSGTSAVAGMLADHGLEFGSIRRRNRFNPRGNREIPELNELQEALLERGGGSWWSPPAEIRVRAGDLRRRNRILTAIDGATIAVKDPRMLVCGPLWSDLELKPIGVVRNPAAVAASLAHRARERPERHPQLSTARWEAVWVVYNRALLEEHRRRPFPILDFDRPAGLDRGVARALEFWEIEPAGESGFLDPGLLRADADTDWTSRVETAEALELWRELTEIASG